MVLRFGLGQGSGDWALRGGNGLRMAKAQELVLFLDWPGGRQVRTSLRSGIKWPDRRSDFSERSGYCL